ncbi:YqcC family protein [Rheinheimera maricola]|uniref:YqcC family protein n=1 Tax=Rheinheimera maricola TaxID=2793282 RepID=A0ABS7XDK8_9GAMM|nr:YqcC family protein [Rheinheimera maricola]MBZ9612852.1 YqcC family protein [Rheinheimera maricola]
MSKVVQRLLDELTAELKQQQLWSALPADPIAMQSSLPFCYDTMPLQQWLQYIFLPRMQALLEAQLALPSQISVLPMAEQAFATSGGRLGKLLNIIASIDSVLSEQA